MNKQITCPDCGAAVDQAHVKECDIEPCSICGGQRITCDCEGHDPQASAWTGEWPLLKSEKVRDVLREMLDFYQEEDLALPKDVRTIGACIEFEQWGSENLLDEYLDQFLDFPLEEWHRLSKYVLPRTADDHVDWERIWNTVYNVVGC